MKIDVRDCKCSDPDCWMRTLALDGVDLMSADAGAVEAWADRLRKAVADERTAFLSMLDEAAAEWPEDAKVWESDDVIPMARADLARELAVKVRART